MVVDGDRQDLLRPILADDILVELLVDLLRRWNSRQRRLWTPSRSLLFLDDLPAKLDTFITNVDRTGPGDQPPDFFLPFAAKRTSIVYSTPTRTRHPPSTPLWLIVFRRSRVFAARVRSRRCRNPALLPPT